MSSGSREPFERAAFEKEIQERIARQTEPERLPVTQQLVVTDPSGATTIYNVRNGNVLIGGQWIPVEQARAQLEQAPGRVVLQAPPPPPQPAVTVHEPGGATTTYPIHYEPTYISAGGGLIPTTPSEGRINTPQGTFTTTQLATEEGKRQFIEALYGKPEITIKEPSGATVTYRSTWDPTVGQYVYNIQGGQYTQAELAGREGQQRLLEALYPSEKGTWVRGGSLGQELYIEHVQREILEKALSQPVFTVKEPGGGEVTYVSHGGVIWTPKGEFTVEELLTPRGEARFIETLYGAPTLKVGETVYTGILAGGEKPYYVFQTPYGEFTQQYLLSPEGWADFTARVQRAQAPGGIGGVEVGIPGISKKEFELAKWEQEQYRPQLSAEQLDIIKDIKEYQREQREMQMGLPPEFHRPSAVLKMGVGYAPIELAGTSTITEGLLKLGGKPPMTIPPEWQTPEMTGKIGKWLEAQPGSWRETMEAAAGFTGSFEAFIKPTIPTAAGAVVEPVATSIAKARLEKAEGLPAYTDPATGLSYYLPPEQGLKTGLTPSVMPSTPIGLGPTSTLQAQFLAEHPAYAIGSLAGEVVQYYALSKAADVAVTRLTESFPSLTEWLQEKGLIRTERQAEVLQHSDELLAQELGEKTDAIIVRRWETGLKKGVTLPSEEAEGIEYVGTQIISPEDLSKTAAQLGRGEVTQEMPDVLRFIRERGEPFKAYDFRRSVEALVEPEQIYRESVLGKIGGELEGKFPEMRVPLEVEKMPSQATRIVGREVEAPEVIRPYGGGKELGTMQKISDVAKEAPQLAAVPEKQVAAAAELRIHADEMLRQQTQFTEQLATLTSKDVFRPSFPGVAKFERLVIPTSEWDAFIAQAESLGLKPEFIKFLEGIKPDQGYIFLERVTSEMGLKSAEATPIIVRQSLKPMAMFGEESEKGVAGEMLKHIKTPPNVLFIAPSGKPMAPWFPGVTVEKLAELEGKAVLEDVVLRMAEVPGGLSTEATGLGFTASEAAKAAAAAASIKPPSQTRAPKISETRAVEEAGLFTVPRHPIATTATSTPSPIPRLEGPTPEMGMETIETGAFQPTAAPSIKPVEPELALRPVLQALERTVPLAGEQPLAKPVLREVAVEKSFLAESMRPPLTQAARSPSRQALLSQPTIMPSIKPFLEAQPILKPIETQVTGQAQGRRVTVTETPTVTVNTLPPFPIYNPRILLPPPLKAAGNRGFEKPARLPEYYRKMLRNPIGYLEKLMKPPSARRRRRAK
jgi:hypothetical protein